MHPQALVDTRWLAMPAEWAPHRGTILTWPHRPAIWRGVHAAVEQTFAQLAAALSAVETVHINVPDATWRDHATLQIRKAKGDIHQITFHLIDSDDVWARDHGPIFVTARPGAPDNVAKLVMLDWEFNAWGGKFASGLDNQIPHKMNAYFQVPRVQPGLVMEGGSLEVNGAGDLLTTEAVLLNDNRNPQFSRPQIERKLEEYLGIERLHWLGAGLLGDDTDGHIDDIARFCQEDLVVCVLPEKDHPDYKALHENYERLQTMTVAGNRPLRVRTLPSPAPISFQDEHLPASYANFYIANSLLLVPTFAQETDAQALGILQELFADRRVVGIDGRALVTQYGNIHCVTQQIPSV